MMQLGPPSKTRDTGASFEDSKPRRVSKRAMQSRAPCGGRHTRVRIRRKDRVPLTWTDNVSRIRISRCDAWHGQHCEAGISRRHPYRNKAKSRLRFFRGLLVLCRPAHAVADPFLPVGPCIAFSLEQGSARVAVFEPGEGDVQRGARCVGGIVADAV